MWSAWKWETMTSETSRGSMPARRSWAAAVSRGVQLTGVSLAYSDQGRRAVSAKNRGAYPVS